LVETARFCKLDPRLDFKMLHCLSGVDYGDHLTSVVHLFSLTHKHWLVLKAECPKDDPSIPSVANVWRTADWHEREAFDLLGILYEGHPNLKRILLSEDWEGHPLRKDYVMPDDTLFPWEGQPVPEPALAEAIPPSPTAPGGEDSALKRPE
jgi:NADH-quinone oxidoreductase subunit C